MKMKNKRSVSIYPLILMGMLLIFTNSCTKDNDIQVPELTTNTVSNVSQSTASCGGNITNDP